MAKINKISELKKLEIAAEKFGEVIQEVFGQTARLNVQVYGINPIILRGLSEEFGTEVQIFNSDKIGKTAYIVHPFKGESFVINQFSE